MLLIRFLLGLAFGSFLNVVAFRYNPRNFIFSSKVVGGRSRCPNCRRNLTWYEILPLISYAFLKARCRTCKTRISFQYPLVEIISGILFVLPVMTPINIGASASVWSWEAIWAAFFWILLLMSVIDIRQRIIPDEINLGLIILALLRISVSRLDFLMSGDSFTGGYAYLFGLRDNIWINHTVAALVAGLFFMALIIATRGKGMGAGDAKLAVVLGFVLGWPDIIFAVLFAFIFGAIYGLVAISMGQSKLKSTVPFGPFLALGSAVTILCGSSIIAFYFSLFGI